MFRGHVEPALEQVMTLLLSVSPSNTEIHQCLGKCLAALNYLREKITKS